MTIPSALRTKTDPIKHAWAITDDVTRLRIWASDRTYACPSEANELLLGSGHDCNVRVADESGLLSRHHAKLVREDRTWILHDVSKNGTRLDGTLLPRFALEPGCLLGMGASTLVVESGRLIALRSLLARILGWTHDRDQDVDAALQAIRMAATRRTTLLLCSESDPVSIAHQIHRVAMGSDRPFVSCDPKRKSTSESVRWVRNFETGTKAVAAARGGTMCVWASRLPRDFSAVRCALLDPETRVQLVVCATRPSKALAGDFHLPPPITVPSLSTRTKDLDLIVEEYADDARKELGADREHFRHADRAWVVANAANTLSEIETATSRIVALRRFGNMNRAADALEMAHVSLSRWIMRRGVPWRS